MGRFEEKTPGKTGGLDMYGYMMMGIWEKDAEGETVRKKETGKA